MLLIIIAFTIAFLNAGHWLVRHDNPVRADAIVVLMGSISDRVLQTADLYDHNVADKIIVVGPGNNEYKDLESRGVSILSNSDQTRNALVSVGIPADSIILLQGHETRSTLTEALTIREYLLNKPEIDTILLVSSAQHTQRASMIFKSAFRNSENPVSILSSPSKYTNFNAERWWENRQGIQSVLSEYLKMLNFLLIDKWKLGKQDAFNNPAQKYSGEIEKLSSETDGSYCF